MTPRRTFYVLKRVLLAFLDSQAILNFNQVYVKIQYLIFIKSNSSMIKKIHFIMSLVILILWHNSDTLLFNTVKVVQKVRGTLFLSAGIGTTVEDRCPKRDGHATRNKIKGNIASLQNPH
jgi:hypothetical protein